MIMNRVRFTVLILDYNSIGGRVDMSSYLSEAVGVATMQVASILRTCPNRGSKR